MFTAAVVEGMARRSDVDVTAYALSARGRTNFATVTPPGVRAVTSPVPASFLHSWWAKASFPRVDRLLGDPDVVHGTNFVVPPTRATRIVTVHDLTTLHYPELCHPDTLRFPALVQRAARDGAWIHTVSRAVSTQVVTAIDVDPRRVVAVPNGFDPVHGDSTRGHRMAGTSAYVLAVGTVEPRKDLPSLLAAIDQLAPEIADLTLVHAGPDGWGSDALDRAVRAMRHPIRFRRLGPVTRDDLSDLYAGARVFAFPSVYEGFGLPVLEAMSASVPVVATDLPAIREVAGDAAALVRVGDADALATALHRAWTDEPWRAVAAERGLARCDTYSWERCVDGLVALYRRAHEGSGS